MAWISGTGPGKHRSVGDPIDVVTGASTDRNLDFRLIGPVPLEWHRHYSSALADQQFALGRGCTHGYDVRLVLDIDGIRCVGPLARSIGFDMPMEDGAETTAGGLVLRRISGSTYRVYSPGRPAMEFELVDHRPVARLVSVFRDGRSVGFEYDAGGGLTAITDSVGRYILVASDPAGRIVGLRIAAQRDAAERQIVSYAYDAAGNLIQASAVDGGLWRFRYSTEHRLVERTDPLGHSFLYEYDATGRCVRSHGSDGLLDVRLEFRPTENKTVVTHADGGRWTYEYTDAGAIERMTDPYGGVRAFTLDNDGLAVAESDPAGTPTTIINSSQGVPLSRIDALGHITMLPADPNAPDPRAHRVARCASEFEYGWLVLQQETLQGPTAPDLNVVPPPLRAIAREVAPAPAPGQTPAWEVKPLGPRWWPAPRWGRVFDDFGRLVAQHSGTGQTRRWSYDANGNVSEFVDFDGSLQRYRRGSWNLLLEETNPLGGRIAYQWTPTERLAAVTGPGGARSEYRYDLKGRLIQVHRHGAVKDEYRYDPAESLVAKLDGEGKVLQAMALGPAGLVVKRTLASGEVQEYEYDEQGRYVAVVTDGRRTEFAYDKYGHRVADLYDGLGVRHTFSAWREPSRTVLFERFEIRYRWSAGGERVVTDPTGRETRLKLPGAGVVLRSCPNSTEELARFDAGGRCLVKSVWNPRFAATPWTRRYTYSGEGDLQGARDSAGGDTSFAYDAAHRLTQAFTRGESPQQYRYDSAGNLLEMPGLGRVALQEGNRLAGANGDAFEHDGRHRLSERSGPGGVRRYGYDSRDMLVTCETGQGRWQAEYDPLGRRTRTVFKDRATRYYWDTDRLAAEVRHDGTLRIYVYADVLALTPLMFVEYDAVDADPASGRSYHVFADQIGTPIMVQDADGNVVWRARIDPYGTAHVEAGASIDMALRFPGHHHDAETGLHYNRFRYYSPELGRYLQPDPLGIGGGLNLYAYTASPLAQVDVRGLTCPECEAKAKAAREEKEESESTQRLTAAIDDEEGRAAVAKLAGMDPDHLAKLQQRAKERGEIIVVRDSNPVSLCHHHDEDAIPKPVTVKQKTDKRTGLVTREANTGPGKDPGPPDGFHYDDEGVLRQDGTNKAVYGDHDLQGVYQRNDDGTVGPLPGKGTNDPDYVDGLNQDTGNPPMYQHGANDDYRDDDGNPKRVPGDDESFTAIDDNGQATKVGPPLSELHDYYDSKGIPWPYGD
jgi:RHS repeat-associated protein